MSAARTFAYLADGRLFLVEPNQQPQLLESKFVQAAMDRREAAQQRGAWRSKGMMWNFNQTAGVEAALAQHTDQLPVRFTGVAPGEQPGDLYYTLVNNTIGGLFLLDTNQDYERRLLHRQSLELRDIARCPQDGNLACSLPQQDGAVNLAIMEPDGGKLHEITAGDSVDEMPAWAPGDRRRLVFQSAGLGRNQHGGIFGQSPYAVQQLDLDQDRMTTLLENDAFDCLMPRLAADGSLYYIRRPYQLKPGTSPWRVSLDILLFPYRLGRALFHFLNIFSMIYSQKPLTTAGGPKREGPDTKQLFIWGRLVDINRNARAARGDSDRPIAPRDWQLHCRRPDGQEDCIATNVLAYDLGADGSVLYTTGRTVHLRKPEGETTRVASAPLIERVTLLT